MANVLVREFKGVGRSASIRIVPLGDVHIGAAACDEEQFKQTVKYIRDEGIYWIGMGDYAEFINKKDPRFDMSSLAEWIGRPELMDLARAQRDRYLDIVRPIASLCLGLLCGNHEAAILKHYERDIFTDIVSDIKYNGGFADDEPLSLGYSGWILLKFQRKGTKERRMITINLHHGFVGGKLAGGKALNMQRWLWSHDCDIVLFGHSHNTLVQREAVEAVNKNNDIVTMDRVGCYAGTFLKTTQKGTTTYSEVKGYFPLPIGGVEIYVTPFTKGQRVRVMT
jgi:hypothetical protein